MITLPNHMTLLVDINNHAVRYYLWSGELHVGRASLTWLPDR